MKAQIIKPDGTSIEVDPRNKSDFQADELHEIVQGYFEILRLSKTQLMVVNEEGKLLNLEYNHGATLACNLAGIKDIIVGNVLICETQQIR